jgi:hypothetical protein
MSIFASAGHQNFWALVGHTFEGSYFDDQYERMLARPEARYALGDLVTASRNQYATTPRACRPESGQISGVEWLGTLGAYGYDVSLATDSWSVSCSSLKDRHIDCAWHQGVIDRRRKHYKNEHADRFQAQLASFIAAGPEHQIGDLLMWDVPRHKQKSRRNPLPAEVAVMITGVVARSDVRWLDGPDGPQSQLSFHLEWEYRMLPVVGICHHHACSKELRTLT